MIDVIIPCWRTAKTLPKCLGSILKQTMIDDIIVTLSVDGIEEDPDYEEYQDIVHDFYKYMNIKLIGYEKNAGPGKARQFGLENTKGKYVTFIDSDDTFSDSYSIEHLFKAIDSNNLNGVISQFNAVNDVGDMMIQQPGFIWMFGKIFRRTFLESNHIAFSTTRANEDVGFNKQFALLCPDNKRAPLPISTYTWEYNANSITRNAGGEYERGICIPGFVFNNLYAFRRVITQGKRIEDMKLEITESMFSMYWNYIKLDSFKDETNNKELLRYAKAFKEEFYIKILNIISKEELGILYSNTAVVNYQQTINGIIPDFTFNQFLEMLDDFVYDGNQPELY